jgi:hypothetical protein
MISYDKIRIEFITKFVDSCKFMPSREGQKNKSRNPFALSMIARVISMKMTWIYPILEAVLPPFVSWYMRLLDKTIDLTIFGPTGKEENPREIFPPIRQDIICIWHGRFFYFCVLRKYGRCGTMVSLSRDGSMITTVLEKLGVYVFRGSSSKGGKEAFYNLANFVAEKQIVPLMLSDGPRGPRYHLKPGVIRLAQIMQRPIHPMAFSCQRAIFFKSWDRFLLPLPFTKGILKIGKPFFVPPELTEEEFEKLRCDVENSMNEIRVQVDQMCKKNPE